MSLSQFYVVLSLAVVMPVSAVRFTAGPWQSVSQEPASVTINPREATVHVGETQTFEVIVKGTQSSGAQWAVKERNGGRITEHGTYTAPRHVGPYHVVAISEENPDARAVSKVTVVTEYDTPAGAEVGPTCVARNFHLSSEKTGGRCEYRQTSSCIPCYVVGCNSHCGCR